LGEEQQRAGDEQPSAAPEDAESERDAEQWHATF
jgi:hypothetical protein